MPYTKAYDELILRSTNTYMPLGFDPLKIKAQLIQESQLDPSARSKAGAEGIAQFMPATWREAKFRLGLPDFATPLIPEYAIPACAWYMRKMWNSWTNPSRTLLDRWHLALASYNAGFGNLEEAQKRAGGVIEYDGIIAHLHEITGADNAAETSGYITHIDRYYAELQKAA